MRRTTRMESPVSIGFFSPSNTKMLAESLGGLLGSLGRTLVIIEICFVLLYPLVYAVSVAFRLPADLNDPSVVWIPRNVTIANLAAVWDFLHFPRLLLNTLVIAGGSAVLQTLVCAFVGYGFARFEFRERGILFALVLVTIVLPPQAVIIANFIQFKSLGLLDSPLAFYLPALSGMGIRSGLFIFIYRQFFRSMPIALEDAASIDGAGPVRTFFTIMLPNAGSSVIIVFLFSLVWYWNDNFFAGMYLERFGTVSTALEMLRSNLSIMIPGIQADQFTMSCYMQAGVVLTMMPVLIIYIVLQHYFTESIARSGLVG